MAYQYAIADRQGWQVDSPTLRFGTTVIFAGCAKHSGAERIPYAFFSRFNWLRDEAEFTGLQPAKPRLDRKRHIATSTLTAGTMKGRRTQTRRTHKTKVRER